MLRIVKYYETIRYLRPIQIFSRILMMFKTSKKPVVSDIPNAKSINLLIPKLDLDNEYLNRFPPELIIEGKVPLLHKIVVIDFSAANRDSMSPLLWFNLQYFEFAISLGAHYRATGNMRYVASFKECYSKYLEADIDYEPYVISLHIPNVLICMELFGDALDSDFRLLINKEIFKQYLYLREHLETHLLGNHYFENLKALIIAADYFKDEKKISKYWRMLEKQLQEQILADGMHFELSPMYHKIIIEDLLRLGKLERSLSKEWLRETCERMLIAMHTLEDDMGRTPLFNDSGDNVAKQMKNLDAAAEEVYGIKAHRVAQLDSAGYYRIEAGKNVLIVDCGVIGPQYMPGHGHCDCLSFELSIDREPIFVNSGTYQYQGDKRGYFRSTQSHNTVMLDGQEQSECWGEHRVAKRICGVECTRTTNQIDGKYYNYRGRIHKRTFKLSSSSLTILDSTEGTSFIDSYLHVAPGHTVTDDLCVVDNVGNKRCRIEPLNLEYRIIRSADLCMHAKDFGALEHSECIHFFGEIHQKKENDVYGYKIQL